MKEGSCTRNGPLLFAFSGPSAVLWEKGSRSRRRACPSAPPLRCAVRPCHSSGPAAGLDPLSPAASLEGSFFGRGAWADSVFTPPSADALGPAAPEDPFAVTLESLRCCPPPPPGALPIPWRPARIMRKGTPRGCPPSSWTWGMHPDSLWSTARATAPSPGRPTPGVVKQDKSSGGSVDTTKTRSGPRRVRMSSGEGPIGAAKGTPTSTMASCQPQGFA